MAKNTLLPVIRWRQKRGPILDLLDALNSGRQQKVIAADYGISRSELCKFIANTFNVRYVVKPEILDALEAIDNEQHKRMEKAKHEAAKIIQLTDTRKAQNE